MAKPDIAGAAKGMADRVGQAADKLSSGTTATRSAKPVKGVSPNPMTNLVLADIALRGGGQVLRRLVETGLLGQAMGLGTGKAKKLIRGRSMTQTLVSTAIARIATRSVPGALLVGGGLLAKTLYDRKRGEAAAEEGKKAVEEQARRGRS